MEGEIQLRTFSKNHDDFGQQKEKFLPLLATLQIFFLFYTRAHTHTHPHTYINFMMVGKVELYQG